MPPDPPSTASTTRNPGQPAEPLVTVITATFNAASTLPACLASVSAQDYPNFEHLIIDGASTDGTLDLLEQNPDPRRQIFSEPDTGIYDAWNKGLRMARGDWIAFLGADDQYLPGAIADYMQLALQHPGAQYLSSQVSWTRPGGGSQIIGKPWSWPRFARYMCTAHVGSMHRRTLFQQYGPYDTSLRIVADYELLLRAGPTLAAEFLPRVTVRMAHGGLSDSLAAIEEAALVKRTTGRKNRAQVELETAWARLAFHSRPLLDLRP